MFSNFITFIKKKFFLIISILIFSLNINSQEYLDTVIDRINSIETELKDLRNNNQKNTKNLNSTNFTNTVASHEQRLINIEEDIRSLNGYLDEINYKLDQLVENINEFKVKSTLIEKVDKTDQMQQKDKNITENTFVEEKKTIINADPNIKNNPGMKVLGVIDDEQKDKKSPDDNLEGSESAATKNENLKTSKISEGDLEKLSKSPSTMYKYAYDMLVMENYVESENAFKVFIGEHPKDPLASNAYYWLGETYYVQKKFQLAAISFARGYQSFPKGNKALDQLFKLSLTFINMGKYEDACASFSKLEVEFPKAPKRISNRAKEYKKRAKC